MGLRVVASAMLSWRGAMAEGIGLWGLVAQLSLPAPWEGLLQFGALGILAYAVHKLFRELSAQRGMAKEEREAAKMERDASLATLNTICARWDQHEQARHEDMEAVRKAVHDNQLHCAKVLGKQGQ